MNRVRFPVQTLEDGEGGGDEIAVLQASLLEAAGVEAALIGVPGDTFVAFAVSSSPDVVIESHGRPNAFIYIDGRAWIPLAAAVPDGEFLAAWDEGIRSWREHNRRGEAALLPVRDGWLAYAPAEFRVSAADAELPSRQDFLRGFAAEIGGIVDREIGPRVAEIADELESGGDAAVLGNRLGMLYVRYGRFEEAEAAFTAASTETGYFPAAFNLGSLAYLRDDFEAALRFYEKARKIRPASNRLFLALSMTYRELGQTELSGDYYARLFEKDPQTARKYAYLDPIESGDTGSAAEDRRRIPWIPD